MTGEESYDTAGGTVFVPASGYRDKSPGVLLNVGSNGYYWSAVPVSTGNGRFLYFYSSHISPLNNLPRSYGYSVRPVRE